MKRFVFKKYKKFYEKNGYIPKMFNPYNETEITDIAPTLLTCCGSTTSSATVLIIEEFGGKNETEEIKTALDDKR